MVDERFIREVKEAAMNHLKVNFATVEREAINDEGLPVMQTVGQVSLIWDKNPIAASEAVILETLVQPAGGPTGFGA